MPKLDKTKGECLFFVDNEQIIVDMAKQFLEELGYTVRTSTVGSEAVEVFESCHHQLDLVILDMLMPGLDGKHLFHRFRDRAPRVKVLFVSGCDKAGEVQSLIAHGDGGFLQKPFRMSELARKVREVLDD
jgi:CheY-like chemotaxis protein